MDDLKGAVRIRDEDVLGDQTNEYICVDIGEPIGDGCVE